MPDKPTNSAAEDLYAQLGPVVGERCRARGQVTLQDFHEAALMRGDSVQVMRVDSAQTKPAAAATPTSPEIRQLERQLAIAKEQADLHAKAMRLGELIEVKRLDATGRPISYFFGDPAMCWDQFKAPVRRVVGLNAKAN